MTPQQPTQPGTVADHVISSADLQALVNAMVALENSSKALMDAMKAQIPTFVHEEMYDPAGKSLILTPYMQTLEVIDHILVVIPTGCVGTVTLGSLVIPNLSPGSGDLRPGKPLMPTDPRTLTLTGSPTTGSGLYLYGKAYPIPRAVQ